MSVNFLDFERPIADLEAKIEELRHVDGDPGINIGEEIERLRSKSEGADALDLRQADSLADRAPRAPSAAAVHPRLPERASSPSSPSCTAIGSLPRTGRSSAVWRDSTGTRSSSSDTRKDGRRRRTSIGASACRVPRATARPCGCSRWPSVSACRSSASSTRPAPIRASAPKSEDRPKRSHAICMSCRPSTSLILCTVIGEGGSGGALAIGVADCVMMLQYSTYSVISPEGCASILWKSAERAADAAQAMGITSDRLRELGLIDRIVEEPLGGAHRDPDAMADRARGRARRGARGARLAWTSSLSSAALPAADELRAIQGAGAAGIALIPRSSLARPRYASAPFFPDAGRVPGRHRLVTGMRRPFVAGNWKMNGSRGHARALVAGVCEGARDLPEVDVGVCPPFVYVSDAVTAIGTGRYPSRRPELRRGAERGAFTGEVSARMLADVGCSFVLVGHSERRTLYGESDADVADEGGTPRCGRTVPGGLRRRDVRRARGGPDRGHGGAPDRCGHSTASMPMRDRTHRHRLRAGVGDRNRSDRDTGQANAVHAFLRSGLPPRSGSGDRAPDPLRRKREAGERGPESSPSPMSMAG